MPGAGTMVPVAKRVNADSHYYTPAKTYQPVIMRGTVQPLPELK